jgi:hypothetical protein
VAVEEKARQAVESISGYALSSTIAIDTEILGLNLHLHLNQNRRLSMLESLST